MGFTSPGVCCVCCKCLWLTWLSGLLYIQWIDIGISRVWFISSMGRHLKCRAGKSHPAEGLSFDRAWFSSLEVGSHVADRLWWEGETLALHTSHDRAVPHRLSCWIRNEAQHALHRNTYLGLSEPVVNQGPPRGGVGKRIALQRVQRKLCCCWSTNNNLAMRTSDGNWRLSALPQRLLGLFPQRLWASILAISLLALPLFVGVACDHGWGFALSMPEWRRLSAKMCRTAQGNKEERRRSSTCTAVGRKPYVNKYIRTGNLPWHTAGHCPPL